MKLIRIPLPRDVSARISMKDAAKRDTVIRIAGFCESSTFPTCYTGFDFNPGTLDRVATFVLRKNVRSFPNRISSKYSFFLLSVLLHI